MLGRSAHLSATRRVLAIVAAYLALAMSFVTGSSLSAMAIPIRDEFALSVDDISRLQVAPEVAGLIVVFVAGALALRFGRRAVLCVSSAVVAVGSLLVSASSSALGITLAWGVVGLGAVALTVAGLSTINIAFDGSRRRGHAFAAVAAVPPVVALLMPNASAYISSTFDWRWTPTLWLGAAVILFVLSVTCAPQRGHNDRAEVEMLTPALGGVVLSALCLAFTSSRTSAMVTGVSVAVAVAGTVLITILVRRQSVSGLDLRAVSTRRGALAGLAVILVWSVSLIFFVNLYLQFHFLLDVATTIALLTLCQAAGIVGTFLFGFVNGRLGAQRSALIAVVSVALLSLLYFLVSASTPIWIVVVITAAIMVPNFGSIGPVTEHFLNGAPEDGSDGASATADALSNIGFAAGGAIAALMIFGSFSSTLATGLEESGYPPARAHEIAEEIRGGVDSVDLVARDVARDPLVKKALVDDRSTIADAQVAALHTLGLTFVLTFGGAALALMPGLRRGGECGPPPVPAVRSGGAI